MARFISLDCDELQGRRGWEINPFALQNCIKGGLSRRQDKTRALSALSPDVTTLNKKKTKRERVVLRGLGLVTPAESLVFGVSQTNNVLSGLACVNQLFVPGFLSC